MLLTGSGVQVWLGEAVVRGGRWRKGRKGSLEDGEGMCKGREVRVEGSHNTVVIKLREG